MSEQSGNDKGADFKLEYYKYILNQLHYLNESNHKYLTLFQTLATAVIGGGVLIVVNWKQASIDANTARVAINGLLWLFVILGIFVVFSVVSSVLAWVDYRREEVKLLREGAGTEFRGAPKWSNLYRWSETYLVVFIIVVVVAVFLFVRRQVLPLIQ